MPSATPLPSVIKAGIDISIDRGGTFTDCIATGIPGREDIVVKLLSVDPANYDDAPTEGIRRILELVYGEKLSRGVPIDTSQIGKHFPPCKKAELNLTFFSFDQDGDHGSNKCASRKVS